MTAAVEKKPITIVLVEDHEVTRIGLRSLLAEFPHLRVIAEADTVADAVAKTIALKPDVLLLDIRLKDGSGFDACRPIQRSGCETRVLFLTSFADDQVLFDAIAAGADGYLLKEINAEALVRAIENVAAGNSILDPVVTRRVLARLKAGIPSSDGTEADKFDRLSPQERKVLALVAEGKTNKQIGVALGLSDKTVKNYLSNAMDKLKADRRSQAAAWFVRHARSGTDQ